MLGPKSLNHNIACILFHIWKVHIKFRPINSNHTSNNDAKPLEDQGQKNTHFSKIIGLTSVWDFQKNRK